MSKHPLTILNLFILAACVSDILATDRFYPNASAISQNKRYRVDAKSPDTGPFQSHFKYSLKDVAKGKIIWRRSQKEQEGSCASIFVDDDGWTAIHTGRNKLIVVNPQGIDIAGLDLLSDGLNETERKMFVQQTTAGPIWAEFSHWHFLTVGANRFFVVRPWWGRRLIVDLQQRGAFVPETPDVAAAATANERTFAIGELKNALQSGKKWDPGEDCERVCPILCAVFLAGQLDLVEAIPFLRTLEQSSWIGRSTFQPGFENVEGEINRNTYRTFTVRQLAQFSIRRLGETPEQLPIFEFERYSKNSRKSKYIQSPILRYPRHTKADQVQPGMTAEELLNLISSPDIIGRDQWEYDMDSAQPFTLIVKWKDRRIVSVERETPPVWKGALHREAQLLY